jgi:hypothetical protein
MQTLPEKADVLIIGGGIAGVASALKLAEHCRNIVIVERAKLFSGSSGRNPGRMGHGFHYFDLSTALTYLEASIIVQRQYPDFLVGQELPDEHPIRHGRYYITRNSLYSYDEIIKLYEKIKDRYAELVAEDIGNKVFGEVDSFIRILEPHEYCKDINASLVAGAVETNEHLFNWPRFAEYIRQRIKSNPNIMLFEEAEVTDIIPRPNLNFRFKVICSRNTLGEGLRSHHLMTNFIVNSSWENIELLNDKVGISYVPGTRTNRLKCLIEVALPEELIHMNSAFFCMGSFCMFSNMGDGRGMLTLADLTNMAVSSDLSVDQNIQKYLRGDVDPNVLNQIARDILQGVSEYIPNMKYAKIIGLKFGIVQTKGGLDLTELKYSKEATHHVRNYDGIREEQQGLISNPAMKLFYFPKNAEHVKRILVDEQFPKEIFLRKRLDELFLQLNKFLSIDLKKFIHMHFDLLLIFINNLEPAKFQYYFNKNFDYFYEVFNNRRAYLHQFSTYAPPEVAAASSQDTSQGLTNSILPSRFLSKSANNLSSLNVLPEQDMAQKSSGLRISNIYIDTSDQLSKQSMFTIPQKNAGTCFTPLSFLYRKKQYNDCLWSVKYPSSMLSVKS